jgi:GDP-L-fucose synthase
MNKNDKIYIAGHRGLVGSSIHRLLIKNGYTNILTETFYDVDLRNQQQVNEWFNKNKPDYVFLAAAKVGGISYNKSFPAYFIYDNLMIQSNVIHASYVNDVKKLLFLGSSCIYPKENPLPISENRLLASSLEPTNEAYALAKIAGLKMTQYYRDQYGCNFISIMPCNLYGPNDCFDIDRCHVIPALISKFHNAKVNKLNEIVMWGTGVAKREFLYVDDLAEALYFLMQNYNEREHINVGSGVEIGMKELFNIISDTIGYKGELKFDATKPDGTLSKMIDNSKIRNLGWSPKVQLGDGLKQTYDWYINDLSITPKL